MLVLAPTQQPPKPSVCTNNLVVQGVDMEIHIDQGEAPREDKVYSNRVENAGSVVCQDILQTDAQRTVGQGGELHWSANATGARVFAGHWGRPNFDLILIVLNPTGEGQFPMLAVETDEEPVLGFELKVCKYHCWWTLEPLTRVQSMPCTSPCQTDLLRQ